MARSKGYVVVVCKDGTEVRVPESFALWKVSAILPYEKNPREHDETQVQEIALSIRTYGFNAPIGVHKKYGVGAGHGRLQAALLLGMPKAPVVDLSHLTEDELRAYRIADNKIALSARWNYDFLGEEIGHLSKLPDIDLASIGFSPAEVEAILKGWNPDLDPINKTPSEMPGMKSTIRVTCDSSDEDRVHDIIVTAIDESGIKGVDVS